MFPEIPIVPPNLRAAQEAYENRQKIVKAAEQINNQAENIANSLLLNIKAYQKELSTSEDVCLCLTNFNEKVTMAVESIGYIGNSLISFVGKSMNGKPSVLIQHISQLNFLIASMPKENPEEPHRRIGFLGEVNQ